MPNVYEKGIAISVSKHFTTADFDCHCKRPGCIITYIHPALPTALDIYWDIVGAFQIDDGFRCALHNAEVGGVPHSQHTVGAAADCKSLTGKGGFEMAQLALKVPAFFNGGVGVYDWGTHTDVRGHVARWDFRT